MPFAQAKRALSAKDNYTVIHPFDRILLRVLLFAAAIALTMPSSARAAGCIRYAPGSPVVAPEDVLA